MKPINVIKTLAALVGDKGVVCGGCCRDVYLGRTPKDYDVFIFAKADLYKIAKSLHGQCKYDKDSNTIYTADLGSSKVQLIHCDRLGKTPLAVVSSFPFTINQFWCDKDGIVCTQDAKRAVTNKELVFNKTGHISGLDNNKTIRTFLIFRASYLADKLGIKIVPQGVSNIYKKYPDAFILEPRLANLAMKLHATGHINEATKVARLVKEAIVAQKKHTYEHSYKDVDDYLMWEDPEKADRRRKIIVRRLNNEWEDYWQQAQQGPRAAEESDKQAAYENFIGTKKGLEGTDLEMSLRKRVFNEEVNPMDIQPGEDTTDWFQRIMQGSSYGKVVQAQPVDAAGNPYHPDQHSPHDLLSMVGGVKGAIDKLDEFLSHLDPDTLKRAKKDLDDYAVKKFEGEMEQGYTQGFFPEPLGKDNWEEKLEEYINQDVILRGTSFADALRRRVKEKWEGPLRGSEKWKGGADPDAEEDPTDWFQRIMQGLSQKQVKVAKYDLTNVGDVMSLAAQRARGLDQLDDILKELDPATKKKAREDVEEWVLKKFEWEVENDVNERYTGAWPITAENWEDLWGQYVVNEGMMELGGDLERKLRSRARAIYTGYGGKGSFKYKFDPDPEMKSGEDPTDWFQRIMQGSIKFADVSNLLKSPELRKKLKKDLEHSMKKDKGPDSLDEAYDKLDDQVEEQMEEIVPPGKPDKTGEG